MNTSEMQALYSDWVSQFGKQVDWGKWSPSPKLMDGEAFLASLKELGVQIDPLALTHLQREYAEECGKLWQQFSTAKTPEVKDRRFNTPGWQGAALYSYNAAIYLLNAKFLTALAETVQGSEKVKQKIMFAVQQIVDAMSPANFLATNPEAQAKLIESKGESLARGISNMLTDLQKGRISQSDESAFEIGRNVATTEGTVVFENRLFQLIQYKPLTSKVYERPLLIVPPCINKFYILDLQPENSVVRYAVEQGHTVFLISWTNPQDDLAQVTWDDYIEEAAIKAIGVVQQIAKQPKFNMLGFCVGGTILSTALAVLAARGEQPASSLTLLTTLLDFSDTGALDIFVDEVQVGLREQTIGHGGILSGRELASTFSALRANDLVWNYVQSNYLKGESPPPFDLLYWNADSTNLPGPMFCWYLRNTYLENKLKQSNRVMVAGNPVDLGAIDAPALIYGSREDHIVPWQAAYASMRLLNRRHPEQNHFLLGASGHIAGVINPPSKKRRNYWRRAGHVAQAANWLDTAEECPGSWWPEWVTFLAQHAGAQIKAPVKPGNASFKAIEPAPGRYVKVRVG